MSAIMLVLLFLFAVNAKMAEADQFFDDYCSPRKSNALKGIFVVMVFISHFRGYVTLTDADLIASKVISFLGQQLVHFRDSFAVPDHSSVLPHLPEESLSCGGLSHSTQPRLDSPAYTQPPRLLA